MKIRRARIEDIDEIRSLYLRVSERECGLARKKDEITREYVTKFFEHSLETGFEFIAQSEDGLIGEIHTYALEPKVFSHCLGELTIAVDPAYQSQGIGKQLFQTLLLHIEKERTDILRVELIARESNVNAIRFYESIGFVKEGVLQKRICKQEGDYEADIPMAWFNKSFVKFQKDE